MPHLLRHLHPFRKTPQYMCGDNMRLSTIINRYDGLLLDLWGVIHDGTYLYPGVHEVLVELRAAGKKIIFLSNAPRRAHKVEAVLTQLGIEPSLYDFVVSSGEVGFAWLASDQNNLGTKYFYIGPARDLDVVDGLGFSHVHTMEEADFVLNVGFGSDEQSGDDWMPILQQAKAYELDMVCLNPDLEVVKITGERYPCAGVLAHLYETLGGKIVWFGKPYVGVYEEALRLFATLAKSRLLAIGDSLDTDIPGAQSFGVDSMLITGGILKNHTREDIDAECKTRGLVPTYIMPKLAW